MCFNLEIASWLRTCSSAWCKGLETTQFNNALRYSIYKLACTNMVLLDLVAVPVVDLFDFQRVLHKQLLSELSQRNVLLCMPLQLLALCKQKSRQQST